MRIGVTAATAPAATCSAKSSCASAPNCAKPPHGKRSDDCSPRRRIRRSLVFGLVGGRGVCQLARAQPTAEYVTTCRDVRPYEPGDFYKRELPCLTAVLQRVNESLDVIVIDGFVSLGDKPGLGHRLWESLGRRTPIVGVAKTRFQGAEAVEIVRGSGKNPLFVTAAGLDVVAAAESIRSMHGPFRIPTLLKRVDQLSRGAVSSS
ncbi:MAG: endonuclease V [Pirellulales bacterium]